MKRFLTTTAYIVVTACSFLAYLFLHPHGVKFVFLLIGILSGVRYFANYKSWSERSLFSALTIFLLAALFILLQYFGLLEYGS